MFSYHTQGVPELLTHKFVVENYFLTNVLLDISLGARENYKN